MNQKEVQKDCIEIHNIASCGPASVHEEVLILGTSQPNQAVTDLHLMESPWLQGATATVQDAICPMVWGQDNSAVITSCWPSHP